MVLKLVHSWQAAGVGLRTADNQPMTTLVSLDDDEEALALDYDDPMAIVLRERKAEKEKRQDYEAVSEREKERRQTFKREEQDDAEKQREWHASEQYRHAIAEFSSDIEDARQATSLARTRAAVEQQRARETLEKAQREALVVDGSRVYFTRDGSRLFGEDERQITDSRTLAEAQRQKQTKPDATSYEEFIDHRDQLHRSQEQVRKLGETLDRLDDLDRRVKKGDLSPEDLAQARQEKQDAINSLPPEAREEYQRLQAVRTSERTPGTRAPDPAFSSAPDLVADFRRVGATATEQSARTETDRQPKPERTPVYKSAPDF